MKKIVLSLSIVALSTLAFAQKKVVDVAKFASETIDFGKIKQGIPAKGTFTVTNISGAPLIIEQANPTCGCTISDYTKEPIAAGKSGVINATYNAANPGSFTKHLTVKFAGVDEVKSITFTGEVIPAADFDKVKAEADAKAAADAKIAADAKAKAASDSKLSKKAKRAKKKRIAAAA